ncbi:MAG TPA: hypothetical protein VIV12_16370 [Streptosporangiaceae bacterium]
MNLDLTCYQVDGPVAVGEVDVISSAAITNAALYALPRMPGATATVRVIEPDLLGAEQPQPLRRGAQVDAAWPKTDVLKNFETPAIPRAFDDVTAPLLALIALRLLVGVDHIPSRCDAQRAATSCWICLGATSHDFVLASVHPPGSACPGCARTRGENLGL